MYNKGYQKPAIDILVYRVIYNINLRLNHKIIILRLIYSIKLKNIFVRVKSLRCTCPQII